MRLLNILKRHAARRRRTRVLRAFSRGQISKEHAVRALGLRDYAELLPLLGDVNLDLPRLPDDEIKRMTEDFLRLWPHSHPRAEPEIGRTQITGRNETRQEDQDDRR